MDLFAHLDHKRAGSHGIGDPGFERPSVKVADLTDRETLRRLRSLQIVARIASCRYESVFRLHHGFRARDRGNTAAVFLCLDDAVGNDFGGDHRSDRIVDKDNVLRCKMLLKLEHTVPYGALAVRSARNDIFKF